MGFIAWIVVGALAGFLANKLTGSGNGLVMMVVLGIVGGLAGGFVATNVLKMGSVDGINIESIFIATLGDRDRLDGEARVRHRGRSTPHGVNRLAPVGRHREFEETP